MTTRRQPTKHAKQTVRDAFDADALTALCTLDDFRAYAPRVDLPDGLNGRKRFYHYVDNGSKILAIAHLDTVQDDGTCTVVDTAAGLLACSGALDDRLGAYVILEMLPRLGVTCDWLLTTDEEIGQSTAEDFFTDKVYNWMFQFDRGGTDVVMYQYETPELCDLVEASGARVGVGSYSDICLLDHLGCAGFNWGVGYQDYHSARSHAWLDDTFRMVARFVKFYEANAATKLTEWDFSEWIVADCGHEVDLDDSRTYSDEDRVIVCKRCGTDDLFWPLDDDQRAEHLRYTAWQRARRAADELTITMQPATNHS